MVKKMSQICYEAGPHSGSEARKFRIGCDYALFCKTCYMEEIAWRKIANRDLCECKKYALPAWERLVVYRDEEVN